MPNTYTQLHVQLIFAVKYRAALIESSWKNRLQQFITGIIQNNGHKMLQINNMPDHIHILIGQRPDQALSALIQNVKTESSIWVNEHKLSRAKFAWQEGYGAFSYSKSHVPDVIRYIQNQESHHRKQNFLDEYRSFLNAFEVEYDERYIFTATTYFTSLLGCKHQTFLRNEEYVYLFLLPSRRSYGTSNKTFLFIFYSL